MPEQAVFSVVIPCYNYAHYLPATLDSVLAQDRADVEILLVDDASTDDTPELARRYGDQLNYLRNERNLGAGGAWRAGLAQVRGRYVMKLDADDALLPGCLDAAERAFEQDPEIGAVFSSVIMHYETEGRSEAEFITAQDQTLSASELRSKLLDDYFFRMPGCILRTSILEGHEPPDPELYQLHDWEFFLRVTRGHKARLLREPAAIYRVHDKSITATALFDNRLYHDIQRWLKHAQLPGDRHIGATELRKLRRKFTDMVLAEFGDKRYPKGYATYASKYFKVLRVSGGGVRQVLRLHRLLLMRALRRLGARDSDG